MRWGREGPPPEAYSRITDPGRFQPLHGAALDRLEQLQHEFAVERTEQCGLDLELETAELSRPTVRLAPTDPASAPIVVAFTAFPGLVVRCGRWFIDRFPVCGCDACAETAQGEVQRLGDLIDDVTQGRFRESISLPIIGGAWYAYELSLRSGGVSRGRSRLKRPHARARLGGGRRSFDWAPWLRK